VIFAVRAIPHLKAGRNTVLDAYFGRADFVKLPFIQRTGQFEFFRPEVSD
jgi:hypothetical protein